MNPPPEPIGQVRVRLLTENAVADLRGPTACEVLRPDEVAAVIAGIAELEVELFERGIADRDDVARLGGLLDLRGLDRFAGDEPRFYP